MPIPSGYVSGQVVQAVPTALATAIFNETQSSGTNGGTATAGSYVKRTLNTTVQNGIAGCSIASSVITLPAGTYRLTAEAPVFNVTTNSSRLRNTSDGTTTQQGCSNFSSNNNTGYSTIEAYFTIAASKNFELQTQVGSTVATNGYGASAGMGDEIYSIVIIEKVA